jgi:DNA polymerase (family 10)
MSLAGCPANRSKGSRQKPANVPLRHRTVVHQRDGISGAKLFGELWVNLPTLPDEDLRQSQFRNTADMKSLLVLLIVAAAVGSGCIHTHETVVHDDSRTPVSCESDAAARTFYETLSRLPNGGLRQESKTEISIPIVFEHERKVVRGPNQAFDEAVNCCDTNRDGKITGQEARIFADTVKWPCRVGSLFARPRADYPARMDKDQVAAMLVEIGTLLELKGENPFKTRAYANAARVLEGLTEPLAQIVAENRLGELKGFGEALQDKVTTLVTTGRLPYYEELKASLPASLLDLLGLQGVGPKKVKKLHDELGVDSLEKLEAACQANRVAELDGFGAKSQAKILEAIAFKRQFASRHLLKDALIAAEPLLEALREHPDVIRCSTAGSLRRWKEVIGDIDFLASSKRPADVIAYFVQQPGVKSVLAQGDTKASVILGDGIQADLRVVSDAEYPYALAYFTGSKEHNIVMRQRAIARGLRLNEYGLFRSTEETRDPALRVPCDDEADLFRELGLDYVPPELREDRGEFAAGETHSLPRLLEWTDLRGSLHNHSDWSDGRNSLADIAAHMGELGLSYWAITDHSRASFQANGLDPNRLRRQLGEIAELNRRLADQGSDFRLLTGSEVDILRDGLDFDDDLLAELDVVVASLHVPASDEAENTKRFIRAAENPHVHMLGHLSGRLLLERDAYKVNQQAVIDACAATGTWIELNASPYRFDLDWRLWQYAKSKGVKCVVNCDAHKLEHAQWIRLGAGLARKGWLTKADVINTLPLAELRAELKCKRSCG